EPWTPAPLRIQYKDYATWQATHGVLTKDRDYWLTTFAAYHTEVLLHPDFERPVVKDIRADKVNFQIDTQQTRQLLDFCQRKGLTLYMFFYALLNFLLYRYSQQKDIVIGSAVAERSHSDLAQQIGLYVNILAFRSQIDPGQSFATYFEQIKQNVLANYRHQSFPFQELIRALQLAPNPNRNPLFDVYLAVGVDGLSRLGLDHFRGLSVEPFVEEAPKSIHDLAVNFTQKENHIEGSLLYLTALFRRARIEQMAGHFQQLIDQLLQEEKMFLNTSLAELSYLRAEEQQCLLHQFNAQKAPYPKDKTVVDLFQAQAMVGPDRLALVFAEEAWTYDALDAKTNQLARHLQALGVDQEAVVALALPRSAEMIIAIWGILKAGGAYLPIDPEYPQERIDYLLTDGVHRVLIDERFYQEFERCSEKYASDALEICIRPDQLYSIIYTSGSTGKPKGVLLEHEGLVNHIHNVRHYYQVDENSRWLQFFNIGFDAAAEEIFTSLCFGASLYIRNEADLDGQQMLQLINRHRITHADFSSAYFESFIMGIHPIGFQHQMITCGVGGEKINLAFVQRFRSFLSKLTQRFYNVYGPTETTLTATIFNVLEDEQIAKRLSVPIGQPYPNR
ncbi:MAG: AMP-binding protein, partial [Bacteroidota bacterium]